MKQIKNGAFNSNRVPYEKVTPGKYYNRTTIFAAKQQCEYYSVPILNSQGAGETTGKWI